MAERDHHSAHGTGSYTIFQEPWWLDAVAPGQWDEVTITREQSLVARLPFMKKRYLGITVITMPVLTPTLGPWFRESTAKPSKRQSEQHELMRELIQGLPKCDAFRQRFGPQAMNWLPFYWSGYRSSLDYTYRLPHPATKEEIWGGFSHNLRNRIGKARKLYELRDDCGPDALYQLVQQTFELKAIDTDITRELVRRVYDACSSRGRGRAIFGVDRQRRIQGGMYLVWDNTAVYYILGGHTQQGRRDGISSLLIWEAIQQTIAANRVFDFEGSMIESIERFFRSFGAVQVPLVSVHKTSALVNTFTWAWRIVRPLAHGRKVEDSGEGL